MKSSSYYVGGVRLGVELLLGRRAEGTRVRVAEACLKWMLMSES